MTYVLQGEVLIDSSGAKASIAGLRGEQDKLKGSARDLTAEGRRAASETQRLGRAANQTADEFRELSREELIASERARLVGSNHQSAGQQVGYMTAQVSDLWVTTAAGQDPMQIALQQGLQITQVYGQYGAAASLKAMGSAIVGLFNPINLLTIGSIAAGAAMVQWLTGSSEKARELEEVMADLDDRFESWLETVDQGNLSVDELREKFGAATTEIRASLRRMAEYERIKLQAEVEVSLTTLVDESGLDLNSFQIDDRNELADIFNIRWFNGPARRETKRLIDEIIDDYRTLQDAAEGSVADQITALEGLIDSFTRGAEASGEVTGAEAERLLQLEKLLQKLRELSAADKAGIRDPEIAAARQYYETRIRGEEYLKRARAEELAAVSSAQRAYGESRAFSDQQLASAREMVEALRDQAALREAELFFGSDSLEVAELRLSAERRVYEAKVDAMEIAEAEKDELMAAWDAANGIASVDMAGNISLAADEAGRLAENLASARAQKIDKITNGNADFFDPRNESGDAGRIIEDRPVPLKNRPGYKPPKTRKRGGGSAGLDRERQALERLIARERERLELLRESDPVMQEMIRHRDLLRNATDAERAAVEELIRQRLEEQEALAQTREASEFFSGTAYDALDGLIAQGRSTADTWDQVEQAIRRAALQALLLGEGPFAKLFGGLEGGLIGLGLEVFGLKGLTLAEGGDIPDRTGYLTGPGGDRSDKVPIWGSPGEFMVNARATRQYRPFLEAINGGSLIRGLATGGYVVPPPLDRGGVQPLAAPQVMSAPTIIFNDKSSGVVVEPAGETTDAQGNRQFLFELSDRVGDAMQLPGGGARRALRNAYGLKPKGRLR